MKYRVSLIAALFWAVGVLVFAEVAAPDSTMIFRVEKTALRASTSFVSPVIAFAAYKTPFALVRIEGDWAFGYAQGTAKPGYVPMSALSPVKITLSADSTSAPPELQQSEIVLAGKGFASSLEESLKNGNSFNFAAVDAMEKLNYSFGECMAFIQGADSPPGAL